MCSSRSELSSYASSVEMIPCRALPSLVPETSFARLAAIVRPHIDPMTLRQLSLETVEGAVDMTRLSEVPM
ncbi:hypothetical protein B296_00014940 [Ensete ventricosum]|uniref:Uncharacterized protein n=1 Tax=Ensete ventricosum TaxID=4639 RepID=A0A427AC47_ENSVE|nr:hypothetical protein B296_00014940 [Ensete ventricosum]